MTFDVSVQHYDHHYLLTHGDQFRGGSGISGILTPLSLGAFRKSKRQQAVDDPFDTMLLGHFHQYMTIPGILVNGCFPSDSKVMTSNGYADIQHVPEGELVMSRDGTEQKVTNTFHRRAERLVGFKVAGLPEVVEATPNHLVWSAKRASRLAEVPPSRRALIAEKHGPPQWIPFDYLSPGDYVHVPFPRGDERPVDVETAWAYGLYLAEGNALLDAGASGRHHRVNLTMHAREMDVVERWAAWFEGTFGKTPRTYHRNGRNTSDLDVSAGRDVSVWFRDTFGHGAFEKHLPEGALFWSDELKAALVKGWVQGDGHSAANDDCRPTVSATSISPQLAWGMFYLAPSNGTWPTLSKLSKGGRRKHDAYTVHFNVGQNVLVINGEAFYPIAERFERSGSFDVHDLEVSGEHTYVVGGIGVHNSLKGYDEYAAGSNFGFEVPQQAFWITTPERGPAFHVAIQPMNRKAEGW